MKVTAAAIAMLKGCSTPKSTVFNIEEPCTVRAFIENLRFSWGEAFYERIMQGYELAPHIIVMINGLSIFMKKGLDTELKDGDRLFFAIMVNGG